MIRIVRILLNILKNITNTVWAFMATKRGLYATLTLFVIQAGYIALVQDGGRNEDEQRLFGLVKLYANEQSFWSAPFTLHQDVTNLSVGMVERFSSYLYFYFLSLPLRFMELFVTQQEFQQLVILRFFTIISGILALVAIWLISRQLKLSIRMSNMVSLLLCMTPAFVYMGSIVSYDIPSLVLMFVLVLLALRAIDSPKYYSYLTSMAALTLIISLVKSTYMPLAGITWLVAFYIIYKKRSIDWRAIPREAYAQLSKQGWRGFAIGLALIFSIGLFSERIGYNLVQYQSIDQSCFDKFTPAECEDILWTYNRDGIQKRWYEEQKWAGNYVDVGLLSFTGEWLDKMFNGLYFGYDQRFGTPAYWMRLLEGFTLILLGVIFYQYFKAFWSSLGIRFVVGISAIYILMVYIFNLRSYLVSGAQFAYHGRYILFSVALLYIPLIVMLKKFNQNNGTQWHKKLCRIAVVTLGLFVLVHIPIWQYWAFAGYNWYHPSINYKIPMFYFDNPLIKIMRNHH